MIVRASLLLALAAGCGDNFASVQAADTIEAYEDWLARNPGGRFELEAVSRLEGLYLERARKEKTLQAYDAYLERFPDGALKERALTEREEFLYDWARVTNTLESWQAFLDAYPRADRKRRGTATRMVAVHGYLPHLELSEPVIAQVNLAEDPKGPLDGWGVTLEVTNRGESTIESLWLTVEYLDEGGQALDSREWPVVAPQWPVPIEPEHTRPMKPGQTRPWIWTTGALPERWDRKVRVYPSRIALVTGKAASR